MAEANFLANREARNLHRASPRSRKESDDLDSFWSSVKTYLKDWNDRLACLANEPTNNEADKRRLQEKFNDLLWQLQSVRKVCLSSLETSETAIVDIAPPPPDLPLADVRHLHQELTQCQDALEKMKTELLPKGKFVFRRYREAMRKREEEMQSGAGVNNGDSSGRRANAQTKIATAATNAPSLQSLETKRRAVQDLLDVEVLVDSKGKVVMKDGTAIERETILPLEGESSTLSLRKLRNCTVTLQGIYKSLHMVDVQNSFVTVAPHAIQGAMHVTQCHGSTIHLVRSQQIRLHESTDLVCRIEASATGIILEDCTRIVFQCPDQEVDIKDFDWLRSGVPSPNFTAEPLEEKAEGTNATGTEIPRENQRSCIEAIATDADVVDIRSSNEDAPVQTSAASPATQINEDESDDDEL